MGVLLQMVQDNDDKHEAAHHRLRTDWRGLEQRVVLLEAARLAGEIRITKIEATPPEVAKLQWTWRPVIAVAGMCFALGAGQLWLNTRLEGNVKAMIEQNGKVQDERYASMLRMIGEVKAKQEMLDVKTNTLREMVIEHSPKRR